MNIITCEKILYLLPLYIEGKTNEQQSTNIEEHLNDCDSCFEKYLALKNVAEKIKIAFENLPNSNCYQNKEFFDNNISAYIDNELDKTDYYTFNYYATQNSQARKELEDMYLFDEKLKKHINDNKITLNNDLSKKITNEIKKNSPSYIYELYFKAAVLTIFFISITAFIGYFSIPEHFEKIVLQANNLINIVLLK